MMPGGLGKIQLPPTPDFTAEEMRYLLGQAQAGDVEAKESLVNGNLRLAMSIAGRFRGRGDFEDIFQVACVGLVKAIDRFDLSYDVVFSTYAVPVIMGEIRQFLRDGDPVRVGRRLKERAVRIADVRDELEQELGRAPTLGEIGAKLDLTREEIVEGLEAMAPVAYFQDVIHQDEDSPVLLQDKLGKDAESDVWVENYALQQVFDRLPHRERTIVQLRFLEERTQSEVACCMGISQGQISRLEKRILRILREWLME